MSKEELNLKERILEQSKLMLLEQGFKSLSMRKIAKEAGVTATSIYLHFESKDHLLHSLMEQSIEHLSQSLEDAAAEVELPVDKIDRIVRAYVQFAFDHPMEYQVIYLVRTEEMARYPKEKFRKARRGYELLATVIEEGVQLGELHVENPLIAAYSIWAQLHGITTVVMNNRLDKRIETQEFINSSIDHILQGFLLRTAVHEIK
jgi:AcrR family transcriptional regulator